nr:DUF3320 domain-containing protein [Pseudomonas sp.]
PVSVDIIVRRLMTAFGVSRAGARVSARVKEAVDAAVREHGWVLQDGFVLRVEQLDGSEPIAARDRSSLPAAERKIELIAPAEIRAALCQMTELAFSISPRDLVAEVARKLGFNRASTNITSQIEAQLSVLLAMQIVRKGEDERVMLEELTPS